MGGPHVVAEAALVAAVVDQVASGRIERRLAGRGIVEGGGRRGRVEAPYLQLVMERIWEEERAERLVRPARGDPCGARRRGADRPAAPRAGARESRRAGAGARRTSLPSAGDAVGDEDRARRRRPQPVCRRVSRAPRGRPARALGRAGRPRAPREGTAAAPGTRSTTTSWPGAVLDWGARHEAERALAEERAAARRRHRRLAAIIGLGARSAALMGLLTAYAFQQRGEAQEKAQAAEAAQAERRAERAEGRESGAEDERRPRGVGAEARS